ncbi:MAG: protease inhibitor I42 family protein [Candidatus Electrothrix sp. Rat3]|nr:protease inhibitor I42 family protein [Candidatus Electrothrix rattekaaiensis]
MTIQEEVKIEVGQAVDVSLESMMGSTGYGWELASLEGGVNLTGISVQPTSTRPIAPVIQIFSFRGIGEGSGKAVFVLTAPWKVEEPKKEVVYTFTVVKAEDVDTDDALRLEGFAAGPTANVRPAGSGGIVQPIYSVPTDPCLYYGVCPPGDDCCNQPQAKYGIQPPVCECDDCCCNPPQPKYGVQPPCCECDDCCCNPPVTMKYNVPTMRYNVPPMMRYNFPPMMRYNFPSR